MTDPYPTTTFTTPPLRPQTLPPRRRLDSRARLRRPAALTTELIIYLVAVFGILLASLVVRHTDSHPDYFRADQAWTLITYLTIGYLISQGLSSARSHDRVSDRR